MNINFMARLRNKAFWVYITSAIVTIAQLLGVKIFPDNMADVVNIILGVLVALGVIVDNSTPGLADKE